MKIKDVKVGGHYEYGSTTCVTRTTKKNARVKVTMVGTGRKVMGVYCDPHTGSPRLTEQDAVPMAPINLRLQRIVRVWPPNASQHRRKSRG